MKFLTYARQTAGKPVDYLPMETTRQQRLADFVDWTAKHIRGDEKGEAHVFLDRLFQGFGQKGSLDVGGQPEFRIRKAKEDGGGTAFADYVWKPVVLIEMKKRGQNLAKHYRQAFDYWVRLAPHRPKYVVLCNFDEFWVYDFDSAQIDTPLDTVTLKELPEKWGPLAFLFPNDEKPVFGNDHEAVTREAADHLAACFNKLIARKIERPLAQRFILQMLVSLFAEDIGLQGSVIVEQDDVLLWQFENEQPTDAGLRPSLAQKTGNTGGASDPKAISFIGHQKQFEDFLKAVNSGTRPAIDGLEGRKSVEIILAIYESAWTGRKVTLPLKKDPQRPA